MNQATLNEIVFASLAVTLLGSPALVVKAALTGARYNLIESVDGKDGISKPFQPPITRRCIEVDITLN